MAVQIIHRTRNEFAERALGTALGFLGDNPDRNAALLICAVDRVARGEKQALIRDWVHDWMAPGKPGREFLAKILHNTHPNVRRRYIARMIVSLFFRDTEIIESCKQRYGVSPPHAVVISPTMICNYRCEGCYAGSYDRKDDLPPELFERVLTEAEDLGTNMVVIVGGEPFLYDDLLKIIRRHDHSYFQVYTNASMIDSKMAKELAKIWNIAPQVSVNGPEEYTDSSRGKGAFKQVLAAMDCLREAGCVFGFSTLVTRRNVDAICSEEWIDLLVEKGALYGWLFLYMPVGRDPDISLMPTPEQRNQLRMAIKRYRQTKPILPVDFWNDGPLAVGCISAGREYFHINHKGDIEPCIFCHFSTHNIRDCSVAEALGTPFFRAIRDEQPFYHNTLLPCPMLDNHQAMWELIQRYGAKPTHEGAEMIFTKLGPEMKAYSDKVRDMMDEVWEKESYHDWARQWCDMFGVLQERLEARRQEYRERRAGEKKAAGE